MRKTYSIEPTERKETEEKYSGKPEIRGVETEIGTPPEPKYSISLNQFAAFIDGTDAKKKSIVKDELKVNRAFYPWYGAVSPCIKKSILTGSTKMVFDKINEYKNREEEGKFHTPNKVGTVLALENFLTFSLPLEFRELQKEEIKPEEKHFDYMGIRLNVAPDLVFRAKKNGETILGAVKVIKKKSTKVSSLYLRTISYFLQKYLEKNVAQDEETVSLECCLVIDVFGKKISQSKDGYSPANSKIKDGAREFASLWDSIQNSNDSLKM